MATLRVPSEQVRSVLTERLMAGKELGDKADVAEASQGYGDWLYLFAKWREHTLAELQAVYDGVEIPVEFEVVTATGDHSSPRFTFPYAKLSLDRGVVKLRDLIERLTLAVEPEPLQSRGGDVGQKPRERVVPADSQKVFIVHGRTAGGFIDSVARFIEHLGLAPVILAEQASQGRTLIEKFEANADVGYAVVLLTPEDMGHAPDEEPSRRPNRARQNVILELGYFMGRLERRNVVALRQEGIEVPTDILGIVYIPLDDGGAWKTLLARELQAAGYDIDVRKLLD